ncbi:TfuA-like protein [Streptomyces sp. DSM 41527]|uniref:TfuA-like protein n=1 Tax=Streptomyces mooreae TaxID=3075523 RepID=A0ABU2TDY9_9ACTN|nr:TfuA-like protein [Streptomyces sp. DSM 41527]MDT0459155.1 TfuA-like protein [Streptomyces sp. DSM 41527]
MTVYVFCGPTLPRERIQELAPNAEVWPPVAHGDLLRLGAGTGDIALIIDGYWHQTAPVRHKEILMLLAAGVTVVGAASMGALRAAELEPYGMRGIGRIFEGFHTGDLVADDEVAVLHTADGVVLSEAMVNIRVAIVGAHRSGLINYADAQALEEIASKIPYTRRTWRMLHRAAATVGLAYQSEAVDRWRQENPYDLKRADAEAALQWAAAHAEAAPRPAVDHWAHRAWRTSFVSMWTSLYPPAGQEPAPDIPFAALLQYQQVYDPGFPRRWAARVLSKIAGVPGTDPADVGPEALRAAAAQGFRPEALKTDQWVHWLYSGETAESGDALLLRIMVRSASWDTAWDVWPASLDDADDLIVAPEVTARSVAEALALNAATEEANPKHRIGLLAADRIADHLDRRWGVIDGDESFRTAAARDRGFRTFSDAVEVARTFYLSEKGREAPGAASSERLAIPGG